MKTQKEYQHLFNLLDASARTMLGCWAAFAGSGSGHHGLSEMALIESKERAEIGMKAARHMIGQGVPVILPSLPESLCDYTTPLDAIEAMCTRDQEVHTAITTLYDATVAAGESPHYVVDIKERMNHEIMELQGIKMMVTECSSPGDFLILNKKMLEKYT